MHDLRHRSLEQSLVRPNAPTHAKSKPQTTQHLQTPKTPPPTTAPMPHPNMPKSFLVTIEQITEGLAKCVESSKTKMELEIRVKNAHQNSKTVYSYNLAEEYFGRWWQVSARSWRLSEWSCVQPRLRQSKCFTLNPITARFAPAAQVGFASAFTGHSNCLAIDCFRERTSSDFNL